MSAKKLDFEFGYQVRDVSPLPHYYEEIAAHTKQLAEIGLRGDRNYLFYSKGGLGTAYYETHELELSAQQTYDFFSDPKKRRRFFKDVDKLLSGVEQTLKRLAGLDLRKLSDADTYKFYEELMTLNSWVFTYFLATQPQRTKLFEDEVKAKLKKRVAAARLDEYLATLALSEKPTKVSQEEKDWLTLIIRSRKSLAPADMNSDDIKSRHPELYRQVKKHYQKYWSLSLGDGAWDHDVDYFLKNLERDYGRRAEELQKRYRELENFKSYTLRHRRTLIKELRLDRSTVSRLELLAEIGYYRFLLRTAGFIPVIYAALTFLREIERRLGVTYPDLMYLTDDKELKDFYVEPTKAKLARLKKRVPKNMEYTLLLLDGEYHVYFGAEAAAVFKEYVAVRNASGKKQVSGTAAMRGKVRGTATVYVWGDDLDQKLKEIKRHPILIAGHTRPAMMPLIRQSKGIVTDEGGITSHAAIVSRELGLPSVINTKEATRVFKTGDKIELDAENGVVRKL